ncbi:MAG: hypothetical protein JKY10_04725 [Cohaesibacteraceae bacterium]|nr:hypothetical protein [Cohaesibacteraceae bacterium]
MDILRFINKTAVPLIVYFHLFDAAMSACIGNQTEGPLRFSIKHDNQVFERVIFPKQYFCTTVKMENSISVSAYVNQNDRKDTCLIHGAGHETFILNSFSKYNCSWIPGTAPDQEEIERIGMN